jgi:hypothetical protein
VLGGDEFIPGQSASRHGCFQGHVKRQLTAIYGHRHGLIYESSTTSATERRYGKRLPMAGDDHTTSSERSEHGVRKISMPEQ